jgi:hypothetical protein
LSDESGRREIYVQPFPAVGHKTKISENGGIFPEWLPDGSRLYYLSDPEKPVHKMMEVRVGATASTFQAGHAEALFELPPIRENPRRSQYGVTPDGNRFLVNVIQEEKKPRAITVVLNWPSLLKRKK